VEKKSDTQERRVELCQNFHIFAKSSPIRRTYTCFNVANIYKRCL